MSRPRDTQSRHLDHDALMLWQLLLKEGGYWNTRELGPVTVKYKNKNRLRKTCDRLVLLGLVRARKLPGRHTSFGVTAACKAPPGYGWMLELAMHGKHPINWAAHEALLA